MPSVKEVETGDVLSILITIVIGAFGFFLALTMANALQATIDAMLPENTERTARAWIIFAIAIVIVVISVTLIVVFYKRVERRRHHRLD
jgi:uncharacterized BrkB/YihY/UPF0761 family membrane protein